MELELRQLAPTDPALLTVWRWHQRNEIERAWSSLEAVTGGNWAHFGVYWNGELLAGISLQEVRPFGFEVSLASVDRAPIKPIAAALLAVGDMLATLSPKTRIVSWVAEKNLRSRYLTARFLPYESTEIDPVSGIAYRRYACSGLEWRTKHERSTY